MVDECKINTSTKQISESLNTINLVDDERVSSARFRLNLANLRGCLVLIEMRPEYSLVLISAVCHFGTLGEFSKHRHVIYHMKDKLILSQEITFLA